MAMPQAVRAVGRVIGFAGALVVIPGAQLLVLAGAGTALIHGHAVLAGLIVYALYATWPLSRIPSEVGYMLLAITLAWAHVASEDTAFLLVATRPILHNARFASALERPQPAEFWERYFLGAPGRWPSNWWRARGRILHQAAWILTITYGLAWAATLWWLNFATPSPLRGEYFVALTILIALWMGAGPKRDTYTPPQDETIRRAADAGTQPPTGQ